MTHDELLVRIDEEEKFLEKFYGGNFPTTNALRAVVELHKPETSTFPGNPLLNAICCTYCGYLAIYPCETIQAIEKELK